MWIWTHWRWHFNRIKYFYNAKTRPRAVDCSGYRKSTFTVFGRGEGGGREKSPPSVGAAAYGGRYRDVHTFGRQIILCIKRIWTRRIRIKNHNDERRVGQQSRIVDNFVSGRVWKMWCDSNAILIKHRISHERWILIVSSYIRVHALFRERRQADTALYANIITACSLGLAFIENYKPAQYNTIIRHPPDLHQNF